MTKHAYLILASAIVLGLGLIWVIPANDQRQPQTNEKTIKYWVAPMDANYRRDGPGKSPMGMDLVPVYDESHSDDGPGLKINPAVVQNLGIRSAIVERGALNRTIHTVGYVERNEDATSHIHVRVSGWVEKLFVKSIGEIVEKGDPLFEIYSPELATAQDEYLQSLNMEQTVLKRASFKRLQIMGMTDEDITRLQQRGSAQDRVTIYAPQKGYIDALNIGEGMFVKPGTTIAVLVDDEQAWIMADIFEDQSGWLTAGDKALMTMTAYPDQTWEGAVSYVYPTVDATTRALKVRLVFSNEARMLKSNMYAEVMLFGAGKNNVLSVPKEAVIRKQNVSRVVLDLGEGRFRPAVVKTGIVSGDKVEIIAGLKEGERVVVSGQFLIDSEASADASLLRLTSAMDEVSSQGEDNTPTTVNAMGVLTSLMQDHNMVSIQHKAIGEWDWPAMTMDFMTRADVDMTGLKVGDRVHFILERSMAGEILITHIMVLDRPEISHDAEESIGDGGKGDHGDHGRMNHD